MTDSLFAAYLAKHALHPPRIASSPHPGLGLTVVIPCMDEPDLLGTLKSLRACVRPDCAVEAIVVVNASAHAPPEVQTRNQDTLSEAATWLAGLEEREDSSLQFHLLDFPALPPRHAGVGLARKLGMDEAILRFAAAAASDGIIACLDADCRVEPGYLSALERHFRMHSDSPACSIHFEHDMIFEYGMCEESEGWEEPGEEAEEPENRVRQGIVQYELHLRCVVLGLRLAGHPHAFHTVGSSMAVRASAYAKQGGMNKRKAAEDFYFLSKLMPLGNFSVLRDTTVHPSGRSSHRVPFGTGRAMTDWMAGTHPHMESYSPASYRALGEFMARVETLYRLAGRAVPDFLAELPPAMESFLLESGFAAALGELQRNSASPAAFRKRFFRWMDRFRVLKFLHFSREGFHPSLAVEEAARELLAWSGAQDARREKAPGEKGRRAEMAALLEAFRRMERKDEIPVYSFGSTSKRATIPANSSIGAG